jgi:hypothetical protein
MGRERPCDPRARTGIDFHLDWGASQFLTKQVHVGLVGYVYRQLNPDIGLRIVDAALAL